MSRHSWVEDGDEIFCCSGEQQIGQISTNYGILVSFTIKYDRIVKSSIHAPRLSRAKQTVTRALHYLFVVDVNVRYAIKIAAVKGAKERERQARRLAMPKSSLY